MAQGVGAAVPAAVRTVGYMAKGGPVGRAVMSAVAPFTQTGGRIRAERAVQGAVADPVAAAERIQAGSVLTPAQQTGERKLLEIERKIAESSAELGDQFARRSGASNAALQQQMTEPGTPIQTREFLEKRKERLTNLVETRTAQALDKAEKTLSTVSPNMRQSDASVVVRNELEKALTDSKATENELWNAVPEMKLSTSGIKSAYANLVKSIPKAQRDDIPSVAQKMLGGGGDKSLMPMQVVDEPAGRLRPIESAKELQGLRSKLLEESRLARAAGNYNKARLADDLSDAVLDDLGAQAGNTRGPHGQALRDALDFSRSVKEKFNQGPIGSVLQAQRTGADKVAPELTIQQIIGSGKVKGDVGLDAIMKAAGTPEAKEATKQYMLGRLNDAAVKNGKLNTGQAEKFVRDNIDILDKFPEMRRDIIGAIKSEKTAQRLLGRQQKLSSSLNDVEKSATARYLKAPIDQEVQSIFKAKDPAFAARGVKRLVSKDRDAMAGLRAATMEDLINRSASGVDDFGNDLLSGNRLAKELADTRKRSAFNEILGADKVTQLERIAKDLQKLEKSRSAKEAQQIIDDTPNLILRNTVGTLGARFGAKLGAGTSGASLKTASMMSREADKFLRSMTADKAEALLIRAFTEEDGELLKALLTNTTTKPGKDRADKTFTRWLTTAGVRLMDEETPEQPKE